MENPLVNPLLPPRRLLCLNSYDHRVAKFLSYARKPPQDIGNA